MEIMTSADLPVYRPSNSVELKEVLLNFAFSVNILQTLKSLVNSEAWTTENWNQYLIINQKMG